MSAREIGIGSTDAALRERYSRDVSVVTGLPDAVLRPRDEAEVADALRWCAGTGTAALAVGARTSTTGASVPVGGGLVIDAAALPGEASVDVEARLLHAPPGAVLGDLQRLARSHGLEMPVDPTSAPDCTIGGAVATNASGPSTFRHGAMVRWVEALRMVDGRGETHALQRPRVPKRALGPAALQSSPAWFVGSEGTLGVLTHVTLRLQPAPPTILGAVIGFDKRDALLRGVAALQDARPGRSGQGTQTGAALRSVEWLDAGACALIAPHAGGLRLPERGALVLEVEGPEEAAETLLAELLERLARFGGDAQRAQILATAAEQRAFDALRHRVPDTLNRRGRALADAAGGGKLSTDWSAPVSALPALFDWTDAAFAELALEGWWAYGHIGDGHPHLNLLCADAEAREAAMACLHRQLERVVAAGGVPVSEHGIGKLKRALVRPWLPPGAEAAWRGLKAWLDPVGVLAPGNVFGG